MSAQSSAQSEASCKALKKQRRQQRFRRVVFWAAWVSFCIEVLALVVFTGYVGVLSFLPHSYFIVLLIGTVILIGLHVLSLCMQKRAVSAGIVSLILSLILAVTSIWGSVALRFVYKNLEQTNQGANVTTIVVSVYVRQDSEYETLEQLKNHNVGVRPDPMNDTMAQAVEQLKEDLAQQVRVAEYADYTQLIQALKDEEVDAILLDEGMVANITEFFDADFLNWARMLSESARVEQEIEIENVDVTKTPFIVYISGMDTKGNYPIADNGRSDVNQIAVINPIAKKILLINTPRDTYVALSGDPAKMDKLTHAGVYGINCSIDTLEALYDININYYVKVNFNSLIRIVDALGGITAESDYAFKAGKYTFHKGLNDLNGDQALAFVRHRYNLPGGDMQRGVHQQRVIQAILKKLMSPAMISNFPEVLTAITDNTKTNLSSDSINALIQMQLTDMAPWEIQTYAMFGKGLKGALYAFGTPVQYDVLTAPEEQIAEIQMLIRQIKKGR